MADVEPKAPIRRRTRRSGESSVTRTVTTGTPRAPRTGDPCRRSQAREVTGMTASHRCLRERGEAGVERPPRGDPGVIARRAASLVATLSGRRPESVISIERKDDEWHVGVEVVEVARIPDSADILAVYDVRLDTDGDLISYRRIRRYARGQMDCERQR